MTSHAPIPDAAIEAADTIAHLRSLLEEAAPRPWDAERQVCDDVEQRGLAVIAVLPEIERTPNTTPTRGTVAWINAGMGACETDQQAVATACFIAAAINALPALLDVAEAARAYRNAAVEQLQGVGNRSDAFLAEFGARWTLDAALAALDGG